MLFFWPPWCWDIVYSHPSNPARELLSLYTYRLCVITKHNIQTPGCMDELCSVLQSKQGNPRLCAGSKQPESALLCSVRKVLFHLCEYMNYYFLLKCFTVYLFAYRFNICFKKLTSLCCCAPLTLWAPCPYPMSGLCLHTSYTHSSACLHYLSESTLFYSIKCIHSSFISPNKYKEAPLHPLI